MDGRDSGAAVDAAAKRLQSKVISADGGNQSPRGRRKDKWVTERQEIPLEEEGRNRRRLQDPVALEDANNPENMRRPKRGRFEGQNADGAGENPNYVPRSGPYFEHDDRNWRQRTTPRRRPFAEGGRPDDRGPPRKPYERWDGGNPGNFEATGRRNDRWNHDRFLELDNKKGGRLNAPPPRFRDGDRMMNSRRGGFPRVNGRGNLHAAQIDRGRWGEDEAGDRNHIVRGAGNRFRGAAGTAAAAAAASNPRGGNASEWKHDLFDQRNHSPAAKREEASVARVEALLAS